MLNLILAMLCSAMVSIIMREGSADGRKPLLLVNYITCTAASLCFLGGPPQGSGMGIAAGFGVLGGVLYLGAFLLLQYSVKENGITLSSAFMKLGVIVPTALGFALFHEQAGPLRALGIALTVAAIAVLSRDGDPASTGRGTRLWTLIALMLCGGMADGLSKFYAAYGVQALEGYFLCFVFACAGLLCAGLCLLERQRPAGRDWLFGLLLGIPNYFSSRFLLKSLAALPASIAYPAFSCGTILLAALAGGVLFHERVSRRQWLALGLVLAALILLNL